MSVDVVTTGDPVTYHPDETAVIVPVFGLPGYQFHLIHITGLVCQVISISISSGVVITILKAGHFFRRAIGDRLVLYLAICDLGFTTFHVFDHAYMEFTQNHPPDAACAFFGFTLNQFILAQAIYVIFSALNAFVMVVRERRLEIGKYDHRLHIAAHLIPLTFGVGATATGHFGQSGAWCYVDLRKPAGPIVSQVVSCFIVAAFLFNMICYGAVWARIKQVANKMGGGNNKYHGTAKVMMLFVLVYIMQWIFFIVFCIMSFVAIFHIIVMWAAVFFSNIGGFFNFLAYYWIRKRKQNVGNKETETDSSSTTVTVVKTSTDKQ